MVHHQVNILSVIGDPNKRPCMTRFPSSTMLLINLCRNAVRIIKLYNNIKKFYKIRSNNLQKCLI